MRIFASMLLAPSHMAVAPEIGGLVIAGRTGRGLIDLRCVPDWLRWTASAKDSPLRSVPSCRWIHSLCMTPAFCVCSAGGSPPCLCKPPPSNIFRKDWQLVEGRKWASTSDVELREDRLSSTSPIHGRPRPQSSTSKMIQLKVGAIVISLYIARRNAGRPSSSGSVENQLTLKLPDTAQLHRQLGRGHCRVRHGHWPETACLDRYVPRRPHPMASRALVRSSIGSLLAPLFGSLMPAPKTNLHPVY